MPSVDLFEERDESQIRDVLQKAERDDVGVSYPENHQLAIDYLEGRQLDDVESELSSRYERTQTGDRGGQIAAQCIPLTQRYVDEAASAYAKPVTRTLSRPDGSTDEENTEALNAMLADASFDEAMNRLEQYTVLLKSAGLWFQARGGKLRAEVVWPHLIHPVLPDDDWASVSCQEDYAGFAVEMHGDADGGTKRYAWSEPAQVAFYSGMGPFRPDADGLTRYANALVWPQAVDGDGIKGAVSTLPLQMVTVAQDRLPIGELLIDNDPMVVLANRELNLQLSMLLDTISHQGWATLLVNLMNPDSPPTTFSAGPRNGLSLGVGESANMLSSPVNYTDLANVLQTWVRMLAMAQSQSPNDFSAQAAAATSGFAKLVDSLPKVESRQRRLPRWRRWERITAWPRLAAIGDALGRLKGGIDYLATLTLGVDYQPLEFPESVPERVQRETHELALGHTTPAKLLAKRTGMSIEEAEAEVEANTGTAPVEAEDGDEAGADEKPEPQVEEIQKSAMNGAQVTSLQGIVTAAAAGELPRSSAIAMIEVAFQLPRAEAERVVGDAGLEPPKPKTPPPPPPGGAPPPAPQQPPPRTPGEAVGQLIRGRR